MGILSSDVGEAGPAGDYLPRMLPVMLDSLSLYNRP